MRLILAAGAAPAFFTEVATLIVAGALIAYISYRLGLVPIVGFLLAGVVIGPKGLGLVRDQALVDAAAEVGVVLLLFTIGIEFSLEKLARIKRLIFGGGGLQVALSTGATMGVLWLLDVPWQASLFTGFLVALSSTAIVLKLLGDRGETNATHGQVGLGLLIFQDLAIIVMALLVPMLGGAGGSGWAIAWALLKAVLLIAGVLVFARRLMPKVLEGVARTCSPELFLLTVIAICFGTAYLTSLAGVSLSLGAFLAGLLVSESRFSEHAMNEILPLQILFSATFFVSVGMLLDLGFLVEHALLVLGVVAAVLVIKLVTTGVSVVLLGYPLSVAAAAGLMLAQVGEFSFVLERIGRDVGLMPAGMAETGSQAFIAATVMLMVLTPLLSSAGQRLAAWLERRHTAPAAAAVPSAEVLPDELPMLENHVIVAGYGRAARRLVRVLHGSGIPHVIITLSPPHANEAEAQGLLVLRGDVGRTRTLQLARIGRAKLLVLADDDPETAHRVATVARTLNPTMRIIARARYQNTAETLAAAGIDRVIAEEFEGIVQVFADILRDYGLRAEEVDRHVETMRSGGYEALRTGGAPPIVCHLQPDDLETRTVTVRAGAPAAGCTLAEMALEAHYGITVRAIHRGEAEVAASDEALTLQPGDELVLTGDAAAFDRSAVVFRVAAPEEEVVVASEEARARVTPHLYGTDWCPLTRGFRAYFVRQGIAFTYHNVETDPAAEEAARAMNEGKLKFPMVVVGEREMKNPTLAELEEALQDYGLLTTASERTISA